MSKRVNDYQISTSLFIKRFIRNFLIGFGIVGISLYLGMLGYHVFEGMSWTDAFVNASMILSGMGPVGTLQTEAGKIFAGCYALFSGILFLVTVAIVFAPAIHLLFHRFHLDDDDE